MAEDRVDAEKLASDTWHLDEGFVTIQGQRHYLWRAVDHDGDIIDIFVQSRRDCRAVTRFFHKLLKGQEREPGRLVTDKLGSYRAAYREVMPSVVYATERYENNRAEVSHQPTRQRERQMRRGRHNDSYQCMDSSETFSTLAVTWCERSIIGNYEVALSSFGMQSRSRARVQAGRLLRQTRDELVPGVEEFLLVDDVVPVEDGAALVAARRG